MPILTNAKHERFAQELAKGKAAARAYEDAGFTSKNGRAAASRLQRESNIVQRVAEILDGVAAVESKAVEQAAAALSIDKQWVMGRLVENVDRAMQAAEVKGPDGKGTGEYKYDGSVANRALELLGKELGMFVDRSETKTINIDVSSKPLTADEWEAQHAEPTAH